VALVSVAGAEAKSALDALGVDTRGVRVGAAATYVALVGEDGALIGAVFDGGDTTGVATMDDDISRARVVVVDGNNSLEAEEALVVCKSAAGFQRPIQMARVGPSRSP
jgi:hypothetical protein